MSEGVVAYRFRPPEETPGASYWHFETADELSEKDRRTLRDAGWVDCYEAETPTPPTNPHGRE